MTMLVQETVQSAQGPDEESAHDSTPELAHPQSPFASSLELHSPSSTLQGRKMRKSCDFCFKRRKRCDGDGVNRCSYCVLKGRTHCIFSLRRRRGEGNKPPIQATVVGLIADEDTARHSTVVLKRYRMTASAATGLVGMKENMFLREFFNCLGYVSLTTPSDIREAMISVMSSRKQYQTIGTGEVVGCDVTSSPWSGDSHQGTTQLATTRGCPNALVCIFWCALALGGLLQGQPESLVVRYIKFAEDALTLCEGKAVPETTRALGIMSVLYGFLERDQEDVMACLEQRVRMMENMEDEESKQTMREGFKFFAQNQMSEEDLRAGLSEASDVFSLPGSSLPEPAIQMPELSDEALHAQIAQLGAAMVMFILRGDASMASPEGSPAASSQGFDGTGASPGSSDDLSESYGPDGRVCPARYAPLRAFLFNNAAWIERLRQGAKRPSIRWGLAIELQGIMCLVNAAMGSKEAVLESGYHCAETFIRYSGLGRFVGRHLHLVITTLVIACVGDQATYDKLAVGFNALHLQGMPKLPTLEERLGKFLSDHVLCRIAERFLREHGWGDVCVPGASDDVPEASYEEEVEEELTLIPDGDEADYLTGFTSCDDPDSPASRPTEPTLSSATSATSATSAAASQYIANEMEKMNKADPADKTDRLWDTIDASDWDDVAASLSSSSQIPSGFSPA